MLTDDKKKLTDIDLICLSKESAYGTLLSNMAGHFCLSLKLIPDPSNDLEHHTNYKKRPQLA